MTKLILSSIVLFSLIACKERRGPEPETSKFTENLFAGSESDVNEEYISVNTVPAQTNYSVENTVTENVVIKKQTSEGIPEAIIEDVPILEDELPILPEPVMMKERKVLPVLAQGKKQTFNGGKVTDGLDLKAIRYSQDTTRTRLVFDSYRSNTKSEQSGAYTFTYNPSIKQITATINGYRKFSALGTSKTRTYPVNSIINTIKLEKYMDDSGFKFNISLRKAATINVFELKAPARIVVDITPR